MRSLSVFTKNLFPAAVLLLGIQTSLTAQNVTTAGGRADRVAKFATSTTLVDSAITEIGGKVGIGVTGTPPSTLTVNGEIQSLSGGIKFPDNTIQGTAAITKLHTDGTLSGAGTAQSPLGLTLPFSSSALASHGAAFSLINSNPAANTFGIGGGGWGGVLGVGTGYGVQGTGLASLSGNVGGGVGGRFVGGDCGTQCTHVFAGDGISAVGGNTALGVGGAGISAQGGSATGAGNNGGNGINVAGGNASGAGGAGGIGIFAEPGSGGVGSYAGFFFGDVRVAGNLSKAGGSFEIDHPLHPEDKYLYHSFVESPDMMNIYNGNVTTDSSGVAVVTLPDWFEALNRDFRYQLTVIGQFAQAIVASKVNQNQFVIKTDKPQVEVSWQVTGIRHDAWAEANRIPVEVEKKAAERGHYLHPELFGHTGEDGIGDLVRHRRSEGAAPSSN